MYYLYLKDKKPQIWEGMGEGLEELKDEKDVG